jgi:acetoin utilization protein AcuB
MLVRDRMTSPVLTIEPKTAFNEALVLMKSRQIRRLPVLKGRRLVGIVTFTDLMRAHPSPATSLAEWEIPSLLLKSHVSEIMTKEVVTISPTASIEEAAVLMRRHKIGGLPVVEQGALLGIITESDIFDAFVDLMGLRRGGARLTIDLERAQRLDEVVRTVRDCDAEIRSLAAYSVNGHREVVLRVDRPYPLHLVQTMTERGLRVTHLAALPEDQSEEETRK